MNNKKGFSLTELVITLVIVAILAIVAIPIYRGYVKKGISTEGKSLLGEINAAQQIYYSRHGRYYSGTSASQFMSALGVNSKRNKYFTNFRVTGNDTGFTAYTNADIGGGDTMNLSLKGSVDQTTASEIEGDI